VALINVPRFSRGYNWVLHCYLRRVLPLCLFLLGKRWRGFPTIYEVRGGKIKSSAKSIRSDRLYAGLVTTCINATPTTIHNTMSSSEIKISPIDSSNPSFKTEEGGAYITTNGKKIVSLDDQSSRLPPRKLFLVTLSLLCALFVSFFEQASLSTALPGIARDYGASTAISWVGASYLVATFIPCQ
jgi:hypothetical protein